MRVHGKWIEGMDVEAVLVSGLLDEESEIVIHALGVLNRLKGLENCILVGMTNIDSGFNWEVVNVVSSVIKDRKDAFIVNLTDEVLMRDDFMMYFSMIINPGQSDSFHHVVRQKRQFQLRDLNPARMLPMEHTYHRALDMVDRFEIPYFGICSGHQHLILKSNGALMEVGNRDKQEIVVLVPGTYGEYLFLTHEERESYHQCQDLGIIMVGEPLFYHKYCGVESNVGEGVNIEGYSDSGIVHVISKEGRAFGVQWHPEGTYFQKSLNPNRHRIYIDNIFDLAFKRHERFQAAVERGVRPDDPELIEGLSSFLKQLEHESIRLCPNLGAPKFIFIDDGDIAEPTDLRSLTSVR